MRKQHTSFYSNSDISGCTTTDGTLCINATQNNLQLSQDHIIASCQFTAISSSVPKGGVIYLHSDGYSDSTSLTIINSLFQLCNTTLPYVLQDGGGAIYVDCGSLCVISCTFLSCSTHSYGGAIYAQTHCRSCSASDCMFISCISRIGGGLMTLYGPSSFASSSCFIACVAEWSGGGLYHDSQSTSTSAAVTNLLFTRNRADYKYEYQRNNRGGGAFEDFTSAAYTSTYCFSFFIQNKATYGVGHDISIVSHAFVHSPFTQCFTTTSSNSVWNRGYAGYESWLPLTNINY